MDPLQLFQCMILTEKIVDAMKDVGDSTFLATICMILEERCKAKGTNVIEFAEHIAKSVKEINSTLGRY